MFKTGFHRTRDGRKAIVLTTDAPGAYPLVGYIERPQTVQPMAWRADGAVSNYGEGADDIMPHAELHPAMAEALRPFLVSRCDV